MTDQTADFQVVNKRGHKSNKPQHQNQNQHQSSQSQPQKKLSFKELLFERNNLKKYQHSPKVDLRERNNTYVIRMELAGLSQSDVNVQVREGQFLLISGTKNNQNTQENDTVIYSECHYGNFMRRVKVPKPIRNDNIHYSLNNGVLYVNVEKLDNQEEDNQEEDNHEEDNHEEDSQVLPCIPEDKPIDFSTVLSTGNWADEM